MKREQEQPETEFWRAVSIRSETREEGESAIFEVDTYCNKVSQIFMMRGPRTMCKTGTPRTPSHIEERARQLDELCSAVFSLCLSKPRGGFGPDLSNLARYCNLDALTLSFDPNKEDIAKLTEAMSRLTVLSYFEFSMIKTNELPRQPLHRTVRRATPLEVLRFERQLQAELEQIRELGAVLAGLPYLSSVTISVNALELRRDSGFEVLLIELLKSPAIRSLTTDIKFSDFASCAQAAELLGSNTALGELIFRTKVEFAHLFVRQLKQNHALDKLCFHGNEFDETEFSEEELMDILYNNPSIRVLNYPPLRHNFGVEYILKRNTHNIARKSATLVSTITNHMPSLDFA